jgi:hypothetical protein
MTVFANPQRYYLASSSRSLSIDALTRPSLAALDMLPRAALGLCLRVDAASRSALNYTFVELMPRDLLWLWPP